MSTQWTIVEISQTQDGGIRTRFYPNRAAGMTPVRIGVMLASAARVATSAFLQELQLDESPHREQIEALIAETFAQDLKWGDLGEAESTRAEEPS